MESVFQWRLRKMVTESMSSKRTILEKPSVLVTTVFAAILVDLVISIPVAFTNENDCARESNPQLHTVYIVHEVTRYGGGLTSESNANARIGESVQLLPSRFGIWGFEISNPTYIKRCFPKLDEGEVDVNRLSNFYGFGPHRPYVEAIEVYDKDNFTHGPTFTFEVVGHDLWFMSDGWLYVLKPFIDNQKSSTRK